MLKRTKPVFNIGISSSRHRCDEKHFRKDMVMALFWTARQIAAEVTSKGGPG